MTPSESTNKSKWIRWDIGLIIISVLFAVAFAIAMVIISSNRSLSALETTLFQLLVLVVGLGGGLFGSYKFGQSSAAGTARETIRPHARSALRSVIVLYRGVQRLYEAIELLKSEEPSAQRLELLQYIVYDQLSAAGSAIADWRDVIPEDFADVGTTLEQPEIRSGSHADDSPN